MKLFPNFPDGRAGIGLLLLRCAAACAALECGYLVLPFSLPVTELNSALAIVIAVTSVLLFGGFFVPLAAAILTITALSAIFLIHTQEPVRMIGQEALFLVALLNAAVTLLGPGAYSLDARLFGRRKVIIPAIAPKSNQ